MELKAVFFDLDDTLYAGFAAGDAHACTCLATYAAGWSKEERKSI